MSEITVGERRYSRDSHGHWHQVVNNVGRTRRIVATSLCEALDRILELEQDPF